MPSGLSWRNRLRAPYEDRPLDQLLALRVFVRIVDAGSFAKAADSLDLPRSSVSKLLQDLEHHLHIKLVERSTRGLTITPEGEAYREQAQKLLADLDEMDAAAAGAGATPRGRLRVDVGSLTLVTDPTSLFSTVNLLAYSSSKVALNAVTVSFAKEFEPFGMKVNAVEPGHVRTDLNGNSGFITPEEGAITAIKMALIEQYGPTGGFFGSHGRQPW